MTVALFLDRDGVVNADAGYVHRIDQFEFIDGIFDLCTAAVAQGFDIVIVTNQSGIGRGLYTERDFQHLTQWMRERFAERGAPIRAVYYCPSHPKHGVGRYKIDSPDRKPGPGMLLKARDELGVDLSRSVLVGDRETDMVAALRAGVPDRCLYVPASNDEHPSATPLPSSTPSRATHRVADLRDAIALLTNSRRV
jgi:D-glycero-D-manno-heptose 1,7-bisphosphate phosphatase